MQAFLFQPWAWYVAGPLIALNLFLLLYFGQRFGVSTGLKTTCSMLGAGNFSDFFKYNWKQETWLLVYILGSIIGGFIAFHFLYAGEAVVVSDKTANALQQLNIQANQSFEPSEIFQTFTLKNIAIFILTISILIK